MPRAFSKVFDADIETDFDTELDIYTELSGHGIRTFGRMR